MSQVVLSIALLVIVSKLVRALEAVSSFVWFSQSSHLPSPYSPFLFGFQSLQRLAQVVP